VKPLVIASANLHKVEEYQGIFKDVQLTSLGDYPPMKPVVEDAPDFVGNAILKALGVLAHTGHPALADDSGLEVDALHGQPGVLSARYADGNDEDRYQKILTVLGDTPHRQARFKCAIAIAGLPLDFPLPLPLERVDGCIVACGTVEGRITRVPRGHNGFGYDPIFETGDGRTTAELTPSEKHAISHRGQAARLVSPVLKRYFGCK